MSKYRMTHYASPPMDYSVRAKAKYDDVPVWIKYGHLIREMMKYPPEAIEIRLKEKNNVAQNR